jgi:hypothetical protein
MVPHGGGEEQRMEWALNYGVVASLLFKLVWHRVHYAMIFFGLGFWFFVGGWKYVQSM